MNETKESNLWEVVGGTTRRKILQILTHEPHYVSQLAKILNKSQPAILKQMKILEDAGIVTQEVLKQDGKHAQHAGPPRHYYKIATPFVIYLSLSPHYSTSKSWTIGNKFDDEEKWGEIKKNIDNFDNLAQKLKIINSELKKSHKDVEIIEKQLLNVVYWRNKLMEEANILIESFFDEEELKNKEQLGEENKYIDRHVLRKILCEDQGCVDEIAHIINKQESVIKRRIKELKMKGLLKEEGDHFALQE